MQLGLPGEVIDVTFPPTNPVDLGRGEIASGAVRAVTRCEKRGVAIAAL